MARRDIVVVGASAGGVEALKDFVAGLPANLPAAVFVVLHMPAHSPSLLDVILNRCGTLPVRQAKNGARIEPGNVYVAIPDRHLMLEHDIVRLAKGPRENRTRPAVDVLFRSASYVYGPRVIGVVLSGALDDGTAGLWHIKDRGGLAVVQSPDDALHPSMPRNALEHVDVDHCVPVSRMGDLIAGLVNRDVSFSTQERGDKLMATENRIAMGSDPLGTSTQLGPMSVYTCPECHGSMVEITQNSLRRYRCHTGHAFSEQTLLAHFSEQVDDHLWNALRAIDERVMMLQQLAQEAQSRGATDRANELQVEIERAGNLRRQLRQATPVVEQN